MPTSDRNDQRRMRSDTAVTGGLTAIVALVLLGIAAFVPLTARNARGETRETTALYVWREMLDNVPPDVPLFLTSVTLTILSVLALVATAYIIVAVARLPQ